MAGRQTARTRARDTDRNATCRALDDAFSEGQLAMDEHQRRIDAAIGASTLAELHELLADLQIDDPLPQPVPPGQRRRGIAIAVAGGLLALIAAVGWGIAAKPDTPTESPTAAVPEAPASEITETPAPPIDDVPPVVLNLPRHMDTVEGMSGVLDEIRKRFGSTMGYELAFKPDLAHVYLPDPTNDSRKLLYTYRGGWGNPSATSRSDTDDLTDLAAFDVGATVAAWRSAPATLQIAPSDVQDSYLDIDHIADAGGLETLIRVTTTSGRNGYIYLDPAGTVLRIENPS